MPLLPVETLSKNCRIGAFLEYLLLIIKIKNLAIIFKLILELTILNFGLLTTLFISFFTIF